MAEWKLKVPHGNYVSDRTVAQSIAELQGTKTLSGSIIKEACAINNIPYYIGFAFCCLETLGKSIRSFDGLSYGMMQTNAITLDGCIRDSMRDGITLRQLYPLYLDCPELFKIKKALPPREQFWAVKYLNTRNSKASEYLSYTTNQSLMNANPNNPINQRMNTNRAFGCRVGMLFLYILITKCLEKSGDTVYLRMDWVIRGYNGGYPSLYTKILNNSANRQLDSNALIERADIINQLYTKPYIKRLCGKNGYFDLMKQQKFNLYA